MLFKIVITPVFAVIALLTFPLSRLTRYRIITTWTRLVVGAATVICGIRYRVIGAENVPREPCVILCKHQSAWETMALQTIFPPQVWVMKRELLWIPFFGWGLAMLSPIAINRSSGSKALRQMAEQGRERLDAGFYIVIFPEGTRVAPGTRGTYHPGGAWLTVKTGALALPVAHNAGECWRKNAFIKHPGLITVSIGKPISPHGLTAAELNQRIEGWIESEMPKLTAYEPDTRPT
ncbi:MAG: lysophospholipid acyltransferase family protein [Burkholderiales bacterium]